MSERIVNVQPKEWNGIKFRSTLEATTAKTLEAMGIPYRYEETKYELLEGFHSPFQKDKVRSITYTPDFIIGDCIILECKGFETPEWKLKKKLVYKYLQENYPNMAFYQIHDARKQLLEALDNHWPFLGCCIRVSPKPKKVKGVFYPDTVQHFDSIKAAFASLNIHKPVGAIIRSLTNQTTYVYGYKWEIIKLNI